MIRSMTGFGRASVSIGSLTVTVELKSVNHRYFEFSLRIPRSYSFLEDKIKTFINGEVSRGKVECYIQIDDNGEASTDVFVNEALASAYLGATGRLSESLGLKPIDSICDLVRLNSDILRENKPELDEDETWNTVKTAVEQALHSFIAMRETEGEKLKADVLSRAEQILDDVSFVEERSPETVREYNEKLLVRMRTAIGDIPVDEGRLLTEAAIYADKVAVAEETVRLRSHIDQLHTMLDSGVAVGRKLDFLVQEINREANTIGSKAQDVEIARHVISVKAEVEKIREQIQNIE